MAASIQLYDEPRFDTGKVGDTLVGDSMLLAKLETARASFADRQPNDLFRVRTLASQSYGMALIWPRTGYIG